MGPDPRFKGGDPEHWMERKTALKQVLKLAPKSTQLHQVYAFDEQPGSIDRATSTFAQIEAPETDPSEQPAETVDAELVEPESEWVNPVTGEVKA